MPIDMSAAHAAPKPPPRKRATTGTRTTAASTPKPETKTMAEKREEGLNGLGQLVGLVLVSTGQYADAAAIGMHFPPLAKATAELADEYEQVAKPIDFLIQMGPFSALIAAATPLVMQLLANHKIVPADRLANQGVVPPEVLESQVRANMASQAAEAMRANQEAIQEARKAEADYLAYMNSLAEKD